VLIPLLNIKYEYVDFLVVRTFYAIWTNQKIKNTECDNNMFLFFFYCVFNLTFKNYLKNLTSSGKSTI